MLRAQAGSWQPHARQLRELVKYGAPGIVRYVQRPLVSLSTLTPNLCVGVRVEVVRDRRNSPVMRSRGS